MKNPQYCKTHLCCNRSRRIVLDVSGVDRPELFALSRPELVNGGSGRRTLSLEAAANTGKRGGEIGRISGCSDCSRPATGSPVGNVLVPPAVNSDGVTGLRTAVENGLKTGVVRR